MAKTAREADIWTEVDHGSKIGGQKRKDTAKAGREQKATKARGLVNIVTTTAEGAPTCSCPRKVVTS